MKKGLRKWYIVQKFESLWFLCQAEGLPKNISIEELCKKHGVNDPTFDTWYRKTHKNVCPVTVYGMPISEEEAIRVEAEKVSEESNVHDHVRHFSQYIITPYLITCLQTLTTILIGILVYVFLNKNLPQVIGKRI